MLSQHPFKCVIRRWINGILTLAVSLALMPIAWAGSYDVCEVGCPYTSIQSALNAASPGSVVTVGPGTFRESIALRPGVVLRGAGRNETVIQGSGSNPVVTASGSSIGRNTAVDALTITGGGGSTGGGVFIWNGAQPALRNVLIRHNQATASGAGVYAGRGSGVLIENSVIRDNTSASGVAVTLNDGGHATLRLYHPK